MTIAPRAIRLADYQKPDFLISEVALEFALDPRATLVKSRLEIRRNGDHDRPLVLDGEDVKLRSLVLDGRAVNDYRLDADKLMIAGVGDAFVLEVETEIDPSANSQLSGLYLSGGNFCTQCEAEGFRRITYFLDRPDVMARFSVTVIADRAAYPVLLSNGNLDAEGGATNGRHWARWVDPYPKSSYLFALVAGDLCKVADRFTTRSGRAVALGIHVAAADADKCDHAMASLKRAMAWDEQVYGREYDLDIYNIVAVGDFNMGAMENKGLNIFNSRYVLAKPETATDADFDHVEGVIAHEYFHNWTGNRVTCRDWFQLSLKEGLTVFRDQEFSADMHARGLKRIEDVRLLRAHQFAEDAGPMAHPVRPDSYIEINNFYTATVYNKGAEVIRMIHALLGPQGFRRGMDLYFERHDGEAVTCDDFVAAMADANDFDFGQFKLWYAQAGTPSVTATGEYDPKTGRYALELAQNLAPTLGRQENVPMLIPVRMALLGEDGHRLQLRHDGRMADEFLLLLTEARQRFVFEQVEELPTPSLLRGFSAPVKLDAGLGRRELAFLARHDDDPFNRWDAMQSLSSGLMREAVASGAHDLDPQLQAAVEATLADRGLDPALVAETLTLPTEIELAERMEVGDFEALHKVREALRRQLAAALRPLWFEAYQQGAKADDRGGRRLANLALSYLAADDDEAAIALAYQQLLSATNMTDELGALGVLSHSLRDQRVAALEHFYAKWRHDPLVLDKWFAVQATSRRGDTLAQVRKLCGHPDFSHKNPNRLRALVASFAMLNPARFHAADGGGYDFLAEQILIVDRLNPQTAARIAAPLTRWRKVDASRGAKMHRALERVHATRDLSRDVYEIVAKSL